MSGTLLAIDGDSLAHRAYHAIPKSIKGNGRPANALVGFAGFLMRLWDAEQPEAVLVGWDSLETPTYRHEALPAYQSGREFEAALLEQLGRLPELRSRSASRSARRRRLRGRRLPRRGRAARGRGPVTVVTSDRDAYQLVSDRVSILQPVKGVSELTRDRPAGGARALRRRARAGARLHRAARRPVGQDPGSARRRPEEGGRRAEAARLARAGARRRPLPADRRRPAALPLDRDDGRRRAAPEAEARRRPTGSARVALRAGARARIALANRLADAPNRASSRPPSISHERCARRRASGSCVATRHPVPSCDRCGERRPHAFGRGSVLVRRRLVDEERARPDARAHARRRRAAAGRSRSPRGHRAGRARRGRAARAARRSSLGDAERCAPAARRSRARSARGRDRSAAARMPSARPRAARAGSMRRGPGVCQPPSSIRSVDLPEPDRPTTTDSSPACRVMLASSTAMVPS